MEVAFEEVGLTIKMPLDVDCYCSAIRVLWLGYDHYSDRAASFDMPELPDEYLMNMGTSLLCYSGYICATCGLVSSGLPLSRALGLSGSCVGDVVIAAWRRGLLVNVSIY